MCHGIRNDCFEPEMAREGVAGGVFGIGNAVFEPGRPSGRGRGIGNDCFEPEMALEGGSGGVFGIGIAVFEPERPSSRGAERSEALLSPGLSSWGRGLRM